MTGAMTQIRGWGMMIGPPYGSFVHSPLTSLTTASFINPEMIGPSFSQPQMVGPGFDNPSMTGPLFLEPTMQ